MSYQSGWNHPAARNNFGGGPPFRPGFPPGMQGGRGAGNRGNFRGQPGPFGFGSNGFGRGGAGPGGLPMGFGPENGFGGYNGLPMMGPGPMGPPPSKNSPKV